MSREDDYMWWAGKDFWQKKVIVWNAIAAFNRKPTENLSQDILFSENDSHNVLPPNKNKVSISAIRQPGCSLGFCNNSCSLSFFCRTWGPHSSGNEEYYLLGYNAMQSAESQLTFQRKISPPSSQSNKLSKIPGWKQVASWVNMMNQMVLVF
jgi:hypothetical protein